MYLLALYKLDRLQQFHIAAEFKTSPWGLNVYCRRFLRWFLKGRKGLSPQYPAQTLLDCHTAAKSGVTARAARHPGPEENTLGRNLLVTFVTQTFPTGQAEVGGLPTMTRKPLFTRAGGSQAWPGVGSAPGHSCMCPHCPCGQAGLRLKSDCPRIPPFPGEGHSRALQKPPGPCRSLQQGQAGCKEAAELSRAQELSTVPARVQISGPSGCSNPSPRCCIRADGGQSGVWTTHLGGHHVRAFGEFYAKCEPLQILLWHVFTQHGGLCPGGDLLMVCCSRSEDAVQGGGWSLGWDTAPHSLRGILASVGLITDTTPP